MDTQGRDILIKALVGSHNYNLNTPESDRDYKLFVAPTFDDLYYDNMFTVAEIGETEDYDIHDIRKLTNLFWRANINFIEVLYGTELNYSPQLEPVFKMRDQIATMNLPCLYRACKGMFYNKLQYLGKGTNRTMHLVEKFGYDTKNALHAYRILDFAVRFADTEFKDFKYALKYDDYEREHMLIIRDGFYSLENFKGIIKKKKSIFEKYEKYYLEQNPKEEIKQELDTIIKSTVKELILVQ